MGGQIPCQAELKVGPRAGHQVVDRCPAPSGLGLRYAEVTAESNPDLQSEVMLPPGGQTLRSGRLL